MLCAQEPWREAEKEYADDGYEMWMADPRGVGEEAVRRRRSRRRRERDVGELRNMSLRRWRRKRRCLIWMTIRGESLSRATTGRLLVTA